jgi:phage terminase Nu1 subunit (DNA packaging protein)
MFMSEAAGPIDGRSVNRTELASICGVTVVTIDAWRQKGCPYVERGGRGKEWIFDTAAVIDWRLQRAVTDAVSGYQDESGKVSAEEADRRKKVANAITAEIAADEALRQVVSRHDAEAANAAFCQVLKTGQSNAASKIAGRATTMTSAPEIETMVHFELNRALDTAKSELAIRWSVGRESSDDGDGEDQPSPQG